MSLTNDIGHSAALDPWALGILSRLAACSNDERKVLEEILRRIEAGRDVYGPLDLASDKRDFAAEATEEATDWTIYRAMLAVQRGSR